MKKHNLQFALANELHNHREDLGLKQAQVAESLDKSEKTYQRWESIGNVSNIYDILKAFEILNFTTSEIIKLFNLPPLTLNELKDIAPDMDTLKNIKEEGICNYIHNNCSNMDNLIIEELLVILHTEYLARHNRRWRK